LLALPLAVSLRTVVPRFFPAVSDGKISVITMTEISWLIYALYFLFRLVLSAERFFLELAQRLEGVQK
jgi:hypothetical protein